MNSLDLNFSEFTSFDSELGNESLIENVKTFLPASEAEGRGAHVLCASGYVLVYSDK